MSESKKEKDGLVSYSFIISICVFLNRNGLSHQIFLITTFFLEFVYQALHYKQAAHVQLYYQYQY